MEWTFAKNDGGRESGFHDAGVETFKGNFDRYLARELIQNSLDARYDPNKPVSVKFEKLDLSVSSIPGMKSLRATLEQCAEYWPHDKKAKAFFESAAELAGQSKIAALRFGDFNTTGVLGSDSDKRKGWYNLIRCAGASSKAGGEGGSFGIGKNAPFAASRMRTVLYSTKNTENEVIFQGVAMLVSHSLAGGSVAQPTGFLGGARGASVRVAKEIPAAFLRKDFGSDIIVLGFNFFTEWESDLVHSVLDNFWPAIEFGDLEVQVGAQSIAKGNLAALLEGFSGREDFTAHHYYRAYKTPTRAFHDDLARLKDCDLYLCAGDADLPKRITMVRKSGMKIFEKSFRSVTPFCGVFLCRNKEGNAQLREMEPPKHDTWDPDHPEKGANRKIEAEYVNYIRSCLKTLTPVDDSTTISIPGLNKFLPDDADSPEENFSEDGEAVGQESMNRRQLPEKIQGRKIDSRRESKQPDHTDPNDGEIDTEAGTGDGTGGGGGDGKTRNSKDGGKGGKGGGEGPGNAGVARGALGGINSKNAIPIRYRTFASNLAGGVYSVSLTPESATKKEVLVVVWTVGDDRRAPAPVQAARLYSGDKLEVKNGCCIGPVKFPKAGSLRLEVVLKRPMSVAMEISAHEA